MVGFAPISSWTIADLLSESIAIDATALSFDIAATMTDYVRVMQEDERKRLVIAATIGITTL
jgi:hypothetical protein